MYGGSAGGGGEVHSVWLCTEVHSFPLPLPQKPDVVVTVCDSAAAETCPVWFGKALRLHWALVDPSKLEGSEEDKAAAFRKTIEEIKECVKSVVEITKSTADPNEQAELFEKAGATVAGVP